MRAQDWLLAAALISLVGCGGGGGGDDTDETALVGNLGNNSPPVTSGSLQPSDTPNQSPGVGPESPSTGSTGDTPSTGNDAPNSPPDTGGGVIVVGGVTGGGTGNTGGGTGNTGGGTGNNNTPPSNNPGPNTPAPTPQSPTPPQNDPSPPNNGPSPTPAPEAPTPQNDDPAPQNPVNDDPAPQNPVNDDPAPQNPINEGPAPENPGPDPETPAPEEPIAGPEPEQPAPEPILEGPDDPPPPPEPIVVEEDQPEPEPIFDAPDDPPLPPEPIVVEPPQPEPIVEGPPNNEDIIVPGQVNQVVLQDSDSNEMGTLKVSSHSLPWGLTNAREVYQSTHYLARTNQEPSKGSIKIPMRAYTAHCTNPTGVESVFVSMTMQDGDGIEDNVGTVFEMQYDDDTGGFERVDNQVKLSGFCNQTHGIAVSSNCSRVAVLCQADPFTSQSRSFDKDLVEEYGDYIMKKDADNYDERGTSVGGKANPEIWLLEWENTPLSGSYSSFVATKQAGGYGGKSAINLLYVENDSQGRTSYAFTTTTRAFDTGGGSHNSGGMFIIDRDNWRYDLYDRGSDSGRGWSFDCIDGHIAHMRTIYNPYTEMYGAVCTSDLVDFLGGRNPWGHSHGTVGVKNENREAGRKGYMSYYVPASNTMTNNGGGHTVVPVSPTRSMMALVAPMPTSKSSMEKFINYLRTSITTVDTSGMTDGEVCTLYEDYDSACFLNFFEYMVWDGDTDEHPVYPNWVIHGHQSRDPKYYSRVGVLPLEADNSRIDGVGPIWLTGSAWDFDSEGNVTIDGNIVGDGTNGTVISCNYGAPQLIDLKNGRFLLGYGKFLCSDHDYTANRHNKRSDRVRGGADMLIPQAYYLMEIDGDGNILEGPIQLTSDALGDMGWGGIDEMVSFGPGKVGWWYTSTPTKDPVKDSTLPNPLQSEWRLMVYESSTP
ncbi:MAG: hypothetical protein AAF699_17135 [Pseudomonadota bacterium]